MLKSWTALHSLRLRLQQRRGSCVGILGDRFRGPLGLRQHPAEQREHREIDGLEMLRFRGGDQV